MPERVPPHSAEAERSVLGAAIQNEAAMNEVAETLLREDFYDPAHAEIFDAITTLYRDAKPADLTTVTDVLKRRGVLEAIGGPVYLSELSGAVPSPSNAVFYGAIVREKAQLRRLIESAGEIIAKGYSEEDEAANVLEYAEQEILAIGQRGQRGDYVPLPNILAENMKEMEERSKHIGDLTGLTTGFDTLNKMTHGLQKSDLIILAARPSRGKTSLALNIAANAAKLQGASVLIFSLEMNRHLLGERLLSAEAEVDSNLLKDGSVLREPDKMERIREASEVLGRSRIHIDDNSGISIAEMKNKCRRLKAKEGLDLVVVDYLQLMDFGAGSSVRLRTAENRQQEISTLSRMMKQLARDMECPVIVLSQLNRAVETRGSHRPVLADLRESGAIEQDADIVLFIYKEENNEDDNARDPETTRRISVAKHRNGETGEFTLRWASQYTKFGNYNPADDVYSVLT
ncbi:MAG: replicative DNA helicase [Clostridiales Family XIII bacterium]|jgi:replicative DNA helicase|nr:replicative DNA helicase [Clostridiales Family XIII bacterium]